MRRSARRCVPVLLALLLTAGGVVAQQEMTPEMLADLEIVRDVAVDPSGEWMLYVLEVPRGADEEPGRSHTQLWLAADGKSPRHFAGGKERISSPAWSPDGRTVTFLSNRLDEKRAQLFSMPADGGEAVQVFDHASAISEYAWSPDGRRIAFRAADAETEEERQAEAQGRDWKVFDEDYEFSRLWLYDLEGGESSQWFQEDLDVSSLIWAPDGESVVFQAARTPRIDDEYMFSKIYRVALDAKPAVVATTTGKLGPMALSPNGRMLAFLGATSLSDPLAQSLWVVAPDDTAPRNLTPEFAGSATDLLWLGDGNLLLAASEREQSALYDVDPADGSRKRLDWPGLIVHAIDGDPRGKRLALVADCPAHPSEVFTFNPQHGPPVRRSHHNAALSRLRHARQEVVEWTGPGGLVVSGVLTYPLDHRDDERYPLVLQVHGGPEGVSTNGWTSSPGYPVQLLAARGYFVLQPNYRGSGGHGVAFSQADHDDLGGSEFQDILAGVDALVERGLVDGDRVGTGGWSYGGYMSAWAATRHSQRFKASVVAAGLTNWVAFAGTTDIPYEMSLVHWNSWWFDEPELHWERSPVAHIDKANTPTLIVTGMQDDRVHPEQSLELYNALRIKNVPTSLVFYPREPHGLRERAHRIDFVERVLAWFDQHLAESD